jgi:hypothetical protein
MLSEKQRHRMIRKAFKRWRNTPPGAPNANSLVTHTGRVMGFRVGPVAWRYPQVVRYVEIRGVLVT